ncbi:reverse transcriptase domain-containing protein [Tanacetum coccineum]|uniref:Reverse transcriptase domain-containing protein n=1 Tax=Tanacetum coccineum TaxID=301880 RepID=A0ABQ5GX26_9ASTR
MAVEVTMEVASGGCGDVGWVEMMMPGWWGCEDGGEVEMVLWWVGDGGDEGGGGVMKVAGIWPEIGRRWQGGRKREEREKWGLDEPYAFKLCSDNVMRRCVAGDGILEILAHCHFGPTEGHHSASITGREVYESGFFWPNIFKDFKDYVMRCDACKRFGNISSRSEMLQNNIQVEAQALPTNDARVVIKFLRKLFARFGVPSFK